MLNPEQFFMKKMYDHPSIYSDKTIEKSKMRVFDYIFNVVGNEYSNKKIYDIIQELSVEPIEEKYYDLISQYFNGIDLYHGYYSLDPNDDHSIDIYNGNHDKYYNVLLEKVCTEKEKEHYNDISFWEKITINEFRPFPNFEKNSSIVYKKGFEKLGKEWIETAIWYYNSILDWFKSEDIELYYNAVSSKNKNRIIHKYKENFKKYNSYEDISNFYKIEYNGDIEKFALDMWKREYNRIIDFITETIMYLENMKESI